MTARAAVDAMMASSSPPAGKPAAEVQMSKRRWKLWLGPPIALAAVALVLGRFQPGAEAGGRVTPRPAGVCATAAPVVRGAQVARGTWWRLTERMDGSGTLAGRTLFAGRDGATNLTLELGTESSASGPVGGIVTITSDDGRFSEVRLVSAAEGCSWLVHRTQDVVRSAILDATSGSVLAHLVSRETRSDKGIWRISGMDPDAFVALVLAPLPAQPDLGQVWATELLLDRSGNHLAVQSCAEAACLTRIVTLDGSGVGTAVVRGLSQGGMIGFTGDQLLTWAHCQGLPCEVQSWRFNGEKPAILVDLAAGAAVTRDGRYLLAILDETGRATRVDLGGTSGKRIQGVVAGDLPLEAGVHAYAGFEVGADEVALAAPGADAHAFNPAKATITP
ncbi:MAG: hypothetical protein ABI620_01280 [Chloroflexota bacterium]